jgi:hypothetical protein
MLKECVECSNQVSTDADACPHCGYRIRGRDQLVDCRHCHQSVIPVTHPHDTISRYCPLCSKPITNIGCRRAFQIITICVTTLILGTIFAIIAWFTKVFQ